MSVGEADFDALNDFFGAITGMETSFNVRALSRLPTMISSPEESLTSEELGMDDLSLVDFDAFEILPLDEILSERTLAALARSQSVGGPKVLRKKGVFSAKEKAYIVAALGRSSLP